MIRGKQVLLRDMVAADIPTYRDALQPGREWQRFDGPYFPRGTPEEVDEQMESLGGRIERGDWTEPRTQLVIADPSTDAMIGRVSTYWQSRETWWLSAGIVLFDPARWGRGLGFEALGLWTEHLFGAIPEIVRLDLHTWSGNAGMMRLAEKLGYQLEARFRRARIVEGAHHDGLAYGVLREEWTERYPGGFG